MEIRIEVLIKYYFCTINEQSFDIVLSKIFSNVVYLQCKIKIIIQPGPSLPVCSVVYYQSELHFWHSIEEQH